MRRVDVLVGGLPHETRLFTAVRLDLRLPQTMRLCDVLPGAAVGPASGDYVLALADTGGITFKRLICDAGRTFLRPLNPMYTVQQVTHLKTYGVLRRLVVTRDFLR